MFGIGTTELFIILGIVIVIFGARRLPELGSGLGQAIKNFKKGLSSKDEIDVTPKKEEVTEGENLLLRAPGAGSYSISASAARSGRRGRGCPRRRRAPAPGSPLRPPRTRRPPRSGGTRPRIAWKGRRSPGGERIPGEAKRAGLLELSQIPQAPLPQPLRGDARPDGSRFRADRERRRHPGGESGAGIRWAAARRMWRAARR